MKKLLGTVSVYLDETEGCTSGNCQSSYAKPLGDDNYEILLTPNVDRDQMEYRGLPYSAAKDTATTLAHEFGHVIGFMLHSVASRKMHTLPSEQEAWTLANIEYPKLDKNLENAALQADKEVYGQ